MDMEIPAMETTRSEDASEPLSEERSERKKKLRREALERRGSIPAGERRMASVRLCRTVTGREDYRKAGVIIGYYPFGSEIDIRPILEDALSTGKELYLPRVRGKELDFIRVRSLAELRMGFHGISEPVGNEIWECTQEELGKGVFVIVPGLGFDEEGNRIGYGGGFYDRFLGKYPALAGCAIAVGYLCQRMDPLPVEEHDIKTAEIVLV